MYSTSSSSLLLHIYYRTSGASVIQISVLVTRCSFGGAEEAGDSLLDDIVLRFMVDSL